MNPDRSLMDVVVGDTLIIDPATYRRPAQLRRGEVTKVARKYLHVVWHRGSAAGREWTITSTFHRATGKQKADNGYSNYLDDAYTIDGWAVHVRRGEAERRTKVLRHGYGYQWDALSTDQLERIAAILEEGE